MMRISIIPLFCLSTVLGIAGSVPDVTIVPAGGKTVAVYLGNTDQDWSVVRLKDVTGAILLNDRIRTHEAFAKKYNLINLPAGQYFLFVQNAQKTVVQSIILDKDGIAVVPDAMSTIFAPAVDLNQKKLDFTMLNLNDLPVTIEIFDDLGRKNYAATTTEQGSIQRRFNIAGLTPGTYTIVTTVHGENFEQRYSEAFTYGNSYASN